MSKLETNQVDPATGTTLTLGTSGDTITIPSGVTIANSGTATGFGGANTPAFMAKTSAQQTITSSTETKVQFDTEVVDTDGCYDNSTNYRFTPTTAGKYNVFINMSMETTGGVSTLNNVFVRLHKNGSTIHQSYIDNSNNNGFAALGVVTAIVDMNGSSDYLEAFVRPTASSGNVTVLQVTYTMFGAFKLIGV
jgi:hypothetical protein